MAQRTLCLAGPICYNTFSLGSRHLTNPTHDRELVHGLNFTYKQMDTVRHAQLSRISRKGTHACYTWYIRRALHMPLLGCYLRSAYAVPTQCLLQIELLI